MSFIEVVSLHGRVPSRLGHHLIALLVSGMLAMPVGMLMSRLQVSRVPPVPVAPREATAAKPAPSLARPDDGVTREKAPRVLASPQNAIPAGPPAPPLPSVMAPLPPWTEEAPIAALPPAAADIPDISGAPSGSGPGALPLLRPTGKLAAGESATVHAQVLALLKSLARLKTAPPPRLKRAPASEPVRRVQPPGVVSTANLADRHNPAPAVIGGAASPRVTNAVLNGTEMGRRF